MTQPEAGEIKTFCSICTHMGCTLTQRSADGTINCPCHGSEYKIATVRSSAGRRRGRCPAKTVTVTGTDHRHLSAA